jgi:hypothetical protein
MGKITFRGIMKWVNVTIGCLMIAFAIFAAVKDYGTKEEAKQILRYPWLILIPFYTILFGIIKILADFKVKMIVRFFRFLDNYFGRGCFDIFLGSITASNISVVK